MGQKSLDPNDLKQNTDLRKIVEGFFGPPARRGSNYSQWHAPDRQDSSPSFTVWQTWYINYSKDEGDLFNFLQTYADLDFKQSIEYLTAGGVGLTPSNHRPPVKLNPHIALTPLVSTQDSPEFTDWQTSAGETVDGLPMATDPAATEFLFPKGYTLETIRSRNIPYSAGWVEIGQDVDGRPAKIAPGIVYTHYDQHGQPVAIFTRLIDPALIKRMETKTIQTAGGKPKLGIYGNLDQHAAPVVLTAGQKDSDLVAQTHPGPVNAVTMGACGYDLPSWVIEKIAALNPPYVLVMFDNDPPSEQIEAEKRAAVLRAGLTCPVLVVPPPQGYKDFSDAVADGYDVGSFWARIVAPVNVGVIELLCDYSKRYDWVKDTHGDLANLAALLWVWHKGIARGLIAYDTPLTITALVELSQMIGEPVSIKVIRAGVQQAVNFGMWENSTFPTLDTNIYNKIPLSKLGKVGNNTAVYEPLPAFTQYANLRASLENEIDTSVDDWGNGEFLEELHRYGIRDIRPVRQIDQHAPDGSIQQVEVNETLDQLNRLVFLSDPTALILSPFIWADGHNLTTYPNKKENERPGVAKCLKVALLKFKHDQNTREVLTDEGQSLDGWQISAATLSNTLGVGVSSISEYRRAAGLATCEQKPKTTLLSGGDKRQQVEKLIGKRKGGVRVWIGAKPSYVTDQNRESILNAVAQTPYNVTVEIQLPSIQYAAPLDEIEAIHHERSTRHKNRVERARKERAAMGETVTQTPPRQRQTPPQIAPDAPEIAEQGYSKAFVYYHLLRLLPDLLEAAKTSLLIARVLVGYGLMKGETMPKDASYKDADLEAAPVVIPTPTANPLPVVTAAPTNRTISPVGQGGYPFGKEKYRLPGLPTDLPNYRDLQKGA